MIIISTKRGIEALDEYDSILCNRRNNPLPDGEYSETHHIRPRSCGGGNEADNLIDLTPEEHFRCHQLLPLIFERGESHDKMVCAFRLMVHTRGIEISAEEYGQLKREWSRIRLGQQDPEFRARWLESQKAVRDTVEYRQKLSAAQKRRLANPEERKKRSDQLRVARESPEWKARQSEMMKEMWTDEEYRREQSERRAETNRRMAKDPEWQRKQAEKNERLRNDPEYLKALSERTKKRMSSPEVRKKYSEAVKKQWQDPEIRKKRSKPRSAETRKLISERRKAWWAKHKAEQRQSSSKY